MTFELSAWTTPETNLDCVAAAWEPTHGVPLFKVESTRATHFDAARVPPYVSCTFADCGIKFKGDGVLVIVRTGEP